MNTPRKPLWPKIVATVVVALPVLYVASFGPACWFSSRSRRATREVSFIYRPMTFALSNNFSGPLDSTLRWYAKIGAAPRWEWFPAIDDNGAEHWFWLELSP
jgi:hypothetical protein